MRKKLKIKITECAHARVRVNFLLEAGSYHLLTQFMNMGKDFTFPLSRRLLETIDIVTQQRGVHPNGTGELCHVDFLVGQEETL